MIWVINLLVEVHVDYLVVFSRDRNIGVFRSFLIISFANWNWRNVGVDELRCSPFQNTVIKALSLLTWFGNLKLEEINDIWTGNSESEFVWYNVLEVKSCSNICSRHDQSLRIDDLNNIHDFDNENLSHTCASNQMIVFSVTERCEHLGIFSCCIWVHRHVFKIRLLLKLFLRRAKEIESVSSRNNKFLVVSWHVFDLVHNKIEFASA